LVRRRRPLQLRAVQLHPDPLERYGGFVNFTQELGDTSTFRSRAVYNRRNSKNQAAPLPLFVGPDAGNGNLLDNDHHRRHQPVQPVRVTLDDGTPNGHPNYAFIGRRVVEGGPRRYDQKVDTYYGAATLDGSFRSAARLVLGRQRRSTAATRPSRRVRQHQRRQPRPRARPGRGLHRALRAVQHLRRGGVDHPGDARLRRLQQHDSSRQRLWDFTANLSGGLFDLPGGPPASPSASSIATIRPLRSRSDRRRGPRLRHSGAADRGRLTTSTRPMPSCACRCSRHALLPPARADRRARYSDYSTSGSTTTFKAGINWKPIEDLLFRGSWAEGFRAPSIGELFGTPSRFDQEIVDPCSAVGGVIPAAVRANCIADGVPANGSYVQTNPQLPVITGGNPTSTRRLESWGSARCGARASCRASRSRPIISTSRSTARSRRSTPDPARPLRRDRRRAQLRRDHRSASGQVTQIRGLLQNIAGIETDGLDVTLNYRGGETGRRARSACHLDQHLPVQLSRHRAGHDGLHRDRPRGHRAGQPRPGLPEVQVDRHLDWTLRRRLRRLADRPLHQAASTRATATSWTRASTPTSSCAGSRSLERLRLRARRQQSVQRRPAGLLHLRPEQYGPDHLRRAGHLLLRPGEPVFWPSP
jgi:iron complex outermembrane receptor protein